MSSSFKIPPSQKRSSIYYIRNETNGLRDSPPNSSGIHEPKSAPLARPPTWERKDSIRSGSVRSFSTSASRRLSRISTSESKQEHTRQSQTPNRLSSVTSHHSATSLSIPPRPSTGLSEKAPVLQDASLSLAHDSSPARADTPPHSSTPRPTLLFAIASDDPKAVERVLEHGDDESKGLIDANDTIGPQAQSALEFTLENEGLKNKLGIVKKLLGYGADPSKAKLNDSTSNDDAELDPATRYYLNRADTATTRRIDALMKRSVFRPLVRMRFGIIGQDRALEQLYRVLSIHSEKISKSPVVVFLCGPSGHGKSMLAHQFGSLLEVPIHTVNMTTLRSADDIWRSYSISSDEDATPCTLVEFLANNEGKRCVVVLDEIEKTESKALWSLLVPWELGRCTFEANSRTIDVRNVIWVGTSNIGNALILDYHKSLQRPEEMLTRNEYVELMGTLRPHVSDQLGASVLSRVSAILPFVPFTTAEKRAIASEFLQESAAEHLVQELSREQRERVVEDSLEDFVPSEGARSLYRAVSNLLIDSMDF
ncbi:P-loop containing nucleoside triphosphate hydrolase protein [Lentinula edodes]|uniref:P-loop containing nucleoside triphosphate hydrolase protein n=1 Tax=Lentinula edodes TaxID=5353 RepID=UPI001E8D9614|nr:P-loop containing nucleoside triphosphate hydrolase protein [Lentinula edodes]KAH7880607.1 P-loop containing nucleoside triphosphate hydrolase protein [Lentinula edodes]